MNIIKFDFESRYLNKYILVGKNNFGFIFSINEGGKFVKKLKKGEHEKAMEKAKEMLDKGCGISEIIEETNLSEENVLKAKRKWEDIS